MNFIKPRKNKNKTIFFIIFRPFSLYKSRFSLFNPINPLRFIVHYRSKPFWPPHRTTGAPRRCPTSDLTVSAQERRPTVPKSRKTSSKTQGQLAFLPPIWPSCRSSGPPLARPYLVALPVAHPEADWCHHRHLPARTRSDCKLSSFVADESWPDGQPSRSSSLSSE